MLRNQSFRFERGYIFCQTGIAAQLLRPVTDRDDLVQDGSLAARALREVITESE